MNHWRSLNNFRLFGEFLQLKFRLYRLICVVFFVALFVEYFWVRKFLFLFEGAIIIRRWGSSDDAAGGMWDAPRFGDIPLGSAKVSSSGFLGLINGCQTSRGGFLLSFEGFVAFVA